MVLGVLILGAVLLGGTLAAQLVGVGGGATWIAWAQGLGVGLLVGAGVAAVFGGGAAIEADPAEGAKPGDPAAAGAAGALVHAPGVRKQGAGHALDASLDPNLEGTISADHKPMRGVMPLPGLAQAAQAAQGSRPAGAKGYLHVFAGMNKGESLLLDQHAVTVGRDKKNALLLKDEGVSQVHAEVRLENGKYVVRDLGSRNGTFINDERIVSRTLEGGDVIGLGGETKIMFQAM